MRWAKVFSMLVIAVSIGWLVLFAYSIGLYVGQIHVITEAIRAGVCRPDFAGGYQWIK